MAERIEWITAPERMAELRDAWDALDPGPFGQHGWYGSWWEAFGVPGALRVCALWRGDELAGTLPLEAHRRGLRALANVHTPFLDVPHRDTAALERLCDAALERSGELVLPAVPTTGALRDVLRRAAVRERRWELPAPSHISPIVDTDGDADAWRRAVKPRWGAPLERFRRKMTRENGAVFRLAAVPEDLAAELAAGFAVEGSGWKGREGTAIGSSPETLSLYRGVAAAWAATGRLRTSSLELDGRLAAWDLCAFHADRLFLVKTGFDESFRKLAPGLVLRLSVIEHCFEHGLRAHELLGDRSEWKAKFATSERDHVVLRSLARRPGAALEVGYVRHAKPVLKRVYRATVARREATA